MLARPLSEDKRNAILLAAAELVAREGLGAATAQIAKDAGVPHGSVFTYFSTKSELLNAVYRELKAELTGAVLGKLSSGDDTKAQLKQIWTTWTQWGVENPAKRRALAQLAASDEVTDLTRNAGHDAALPVMEIIWRVSSDGALAHVPRRYVGAVVEALATTTMEFMSESPKEAQAICQAGFEALWRGLK